MIIAFEGIDGAGKNTLVNAVEAELISQELPVARVGFPRYEDSVHAQLVQQALNGQMGDLIDSINGMATLFALDRAEIAQDLTQLDEDGYVVLLDRFVASNAAYSAARVLTGEGTTGSSSAQGDAIADMPVVEWVENLEFDSLGSPVPDLQIFVDASVATAQERAKEREAVDATRARDAYEANSTLQENTRAAYQSLAANNWVSPWLVVESATGGVQKRAEQLAAEIAAAYNDAE